MQSQHAWKALKNARNCTNGNISQRALSLSEEPPSAMEQHRGAIFVQEFVAMLQACKPTPTWPEKLGGVISHVLGLHPSDFYLIQAIAFSGGPDSTCLLYLLQQFVKYGGDHHSLPKELVAITINHGLQIQSARDARHCAAVARSLQIRHITMQIPWSTDPFPPFPQKNQDFENIAREARYHLLWEVMRKEGIPIIAFGHHADDQVETSLLRISRGSSAVGAGGMRPCRRWGMGFGKAEGGLAWAGHLGLHKWIIRPLLGASKDRLIATCQKQQLPFIKDPTNFQPVVTHRNAIRQTLREGLTSNDGVNNSLKSAAHSLDAESYLLSYAPSGRGNGLSRIGRLRQAVAYLSRRVLDLDVKVTHYLALCRMRSPISTYLLRTDELARITDNSVRLIMVLRVLRYVSPLPWGSTRAEAGRRSSSLQQIIDKVWSTGCIDKPFVAGGGVVWTQVVINKLGEIKHRRACAGETLAWLASRQPPNAGHTLDLDITPQLVTVNKKLQATEILWDNRFLLRIKPHLLPCSVSSALLQGSFPASMHIEVADKRYFLPQVSWRSGANQGIALASMLSSGVVSYGKLLQSADEPIGSPPSVTICEIRSLDADVPFDYR